MANFYISVNVQRLVMLESKGCCEYCLSQSDFSTDSFQFDHIIPVSKNGLPVFENLAYCCGGCNGFKHKKTESLDPLTNQITKLFHPRKDTWIEHFQWSVDELFIEGITSNGRATVELLKLNRKGNLNLRRLLKSAGLHPPFRM